MKEKNLTGTPILGYILPGTQANFYWDKVFCKNNWLGQKIGSKVDWDNILSRKIECDNDLSEIFGWDKMLYEIRLGRNFAWKVTRTISVENYEDILAHLRVTGIILFKKVQLGQEKNLTGIFRSTWMSLGQNFSTLFSTIICTNYYTTTTYRPTWGGGTT